MAGAQKESARRPVLLLCCRQSTACLAALLLYSAPFCSAATLLYSALLYSPLPSLHICSQVLALAIKPPHPSPPLSPTPSIYSVFPGSLRLRLRLRLRLPFPPAQNRKGRPVVAPKSCSLFHARPERAPCAKRAPAVDSGQGGTSSQDRPASRTTRNSEGFDCWALDRGKQPPPLTGWPAAGC